MPNTVVWDLGGVLVDWNPRYLYRKLFPGDEARMEWFLANVCTDAWNHRHDAGYPFDRSARELASRFPEYETHIRAYFDRFPETLGGPIEGSVRILAELRERGTRLLALTNWSAETFPIARGIFDFFGWFEAVVVSGEVKMMKPDPAIYRYLIERHAVRPEESVFIDDRPANVAAAEQIGFKSIRYRDPEGLRSDLSRLGLL